MRFADKLREAFGASGVSGPFCVAEMSGNHGGNLSVAKKIIEASKRAGADAVKFQTYEPNTITLQSDTDDFLLKDGLWSGQTLYDLYATACTPFAWHRELFQHSRNVGITAFSAPFDVTAVELLESLGCPAYKIASCELVDLQLISHVAQTGKPIILSTGMATKSEIDEALDAAAKSGARDICLLHCIAGYPTPIEESNLGMIEQLRSDFGLPIGLSDHSVGQSIAIASAAIGIEVFEKHVMIEGVEDAVDGAFSSNTDEFRAMVSLVRAVDAAKESIHYGPTKAERETLRFRRSLYVVEDIKEGQTLTNINIKSIRPADGLHTRYLPEVLGSVAVRDLAKGEPLQNGDFRLVAGFTDPKEEL